MVKEKQNIIIFDHNSHPIWRDRYDKFFLITGTTNGAYTYSQNIIEFHIPELIKQINKTKYKNILINTVGTITDDILPDGIDLIIYYLHEHENREIPRIQLIKQFYFGRIIFITPRLLRAEKLNKLNYETIFLPMSIDCNELKRYITNNKYEDKRVLFFGNMYLGKDRNYLKLKKAFVKQGWTFDTLTGNKLNEGEMLSREDIFTIISKYKYGIGVGRAVLEMNALGLKTIICAKNINGIMVSDADYEYMKENNFTDVEVPCFSNDINILIKRFDKAMIKSLDVREILPIIKNIDINERNI
jgi:hypothetical protein